MMVGISVVLDTGFRVQRFLDANGTVLTSVNASGARKKLDTAVAALESNAKELESKKQQSVAATGEQQSLRTPVLKLMRSIHRVGKIALVGLPDFSPLQVPPVGAKLRTLLEKAYAMEQAVTPHAQVLIDAGLPADFLTRLAAGTDAIAAAIGARTDAQSARITATGGTVAEGSNVRKAVRALDSLVRLALADDDVLLGSWKSAKRYRVIPSATEPATTQPAVVPPVTTQPSSSQSAVVQPKPVVAEVAPMEAAPQPVA